MRSVYVGPAPRREDVWLEIRTEAFPARRRSYFPAKRRSCFPGEAPVLPVLARAAPVPVIQSPMF